MRRAVTSAATVASLLALHLVVNLRWLRRAAAPALELLHAGNGAPTVSVLVPARDEAERIGDCVRSVLDQRGVSFELLVLDDGSSDGTAIVARAAGRGDERLRILAGRPLPSGWLGKPHACAQLAEHARGAVFVFCDADVVLVPGGLAATIALLDSSGLQLVSPYPRQLADGLWPRLVQPLLQWSWLTFLPLGLAEQMAAPSLVAANGQLLACDAAAYIEVGGHAAVRGAVLEDIALAQAFKRAGRRATVAEGSRIAVCRMYADGRALRDGYAKSLWAAFGSPIAASAVSALLVWLYVLPPAAALAGWLTGRRRLAETGALGYLAAVAGRIVSARETGGRASDAWAHPFSVLALVALVARSLREHRRGTLRWRGRPVVPR
ncbi:MAG: glycosyltransferase family 2 protein [Egibacteraceae bacterium]